MENKTLVRTVVLAVLTVAMLAGALLLFTKYKEKAAYYRQLTLDGERELTEAQAAYDALDPTAVDALLDEAAALEAKNAALEESIAALETENTALDGTIAQKQTEYDAACEANSYYKTVYDTLAEGLAKLEGYIEGTE